jgi:hypothetical protein
MTKEIYFDLHHGDAIQPKSLPSFKAIVKFGRIVEIKIGYHVDIARVGNWLKEDLKEEKELWNKNPWFMHSTKIFVMLYILKHPFKKTNYVKQMHPRTQFHTFWKKK